MVLHLVDDDRGILPGMGGLLEHDELLGSSIASVCEGAITELPDPVLDQLVSQPQSASLIAASYHDDVYGIVKQFGNVTTVNLLTAVADNVPHALPDTCSFPLSILPYGQDETIVDWLTAAEAHGTAAHDQLARLQLHPKASVRDAATSLAERVTGTEAADTSGKTGSEATAGLSSVEAIDSIDAVDALATELATARPEREIAVADRLVAVAEESPDLRVGTVLHLLVRASTLTEPLPEETNVTSLDLATAETADHLHTFAHDPDPTIRRQAVRSLRTLVQGSDIETINEVTKAHLYVLLGDPDPIMRKETAAFIGADTSLYDDPERLCAHLMWLAKDLRFVADTALATIDSVAIDHPETVGSFAPAIAAIAECADGSRRENAISSLRRIRHDMPDIMEVFPHLPYLDDEEPHLDLSILRALVATPSDYLDHSQPFVDTLLSFLCSTTRPFACHHATVLLDRLAREHPDAVSQPLADAGKAITEDSTPPPSFALSTPFTEPPSSLKSSTVMWMPYRRVVAASNRYSRKQPGR